MILDTLGCVLLGPNTLNVPARLRETFVPSGSQHSVFRKMGRIACEESVLQLIKGFYYAVLKHVASKS